jgi:PBP1b-binding outer membrane lipoprotein LpoB
MRFRSIVMICSVAVLFAGCAKHDNDYLKKGGQVSTIVVPPGVPAVKQEPYYPILGKVSQKSIKPVSLKPATLTTEMSE